MTTVGQRVVADIQLSLFARLMRADLAYFHANPTGTLISRFTNDASMLRNRHQACSPASARRR